jgi:hypothetical protein
MPRPVRGPKLEFDGTIHLVRSGKTLCGILTAEMSRKHHWVELRGFDAFEGNCEACLTERQNRDLRARGLKVPKQPTG